MPKLPERFFNPSEVHYPGPQDIVCIDGRWTQMLSGPQDALVRYLDDGENVPGINFGNYDFNESSEFNAEDLLNAGKITEVEFYRIHFAAEENTRRNIGMVKVGGRYISK